MIIVVLTKKVMCNLKNSGKPVSYTHLDVYKRQEIIRHEY